MEENWNVAEVDGTISPCKKLARKYVIWMPPSAGWVKMNFDGASKRRAGFGALIRDDFGRLLWLVAGPYEIASNNEAELKGLKVGLAMCVEKGMEKVVIEGDSQVILNRISKGRFPNWRLQIEESLEEQCERLFDINMEGLAMIRGLVEEVLNVMDLEDEWASVLRVYFNPAVILSNVEEDSNVDDEEIER
ncbi:hypothetical protein SUGI_0037500 [Cryptomeria japonica]|nr:hypothetical protein SUGI_0037500 [Cryptomeria japonica]